MQSNQKSILLNLPVPLCEQVDFAAEALQMTRTNFLRQSILRNLDFFTKHELPVVKARQGQFEQHHLSQWHRC